jgi:hypothetical protein
MAGRWFLRPLFLLSYAAHMQLICTLMETKRARGEGERSYGGEDATVGPEGRGFQACLHERRVIPLCVP